MQLIFYKNNSFLGIDVTNFHEWRFLFFECVDFMCNNVIY